MTSLNTLIEQMNSCQACALAGQRIHVVPGEGNEHARLMFVGEAPGEYEDRLGRPFVGAAGKFLDELLQTIDLNRGDVYIANVIKCRPPGNRDPSPDEIMACKPWLDRQIEIIDPCMIVTLGRFSLSLFLPGKMIGKCHGNAVNHNGKIYFPMYHPAAALHQQGLRDVIKADMLKIQALLKELATGDKTGKISETPHPAQQLSLFE
jgi:DNA polymerase